MRILGYLTTGECTMRVAIHRYRSYCAAALPLLMVAVTVLPARAVLAQTTPASSNMQGAASVDGGAGQPPSNAPLTDDERALHVLNRLAYGPSERDLDQIHQHGVRAYIDAQLNPATIKMPAELQARLDALTVWQLTPTQIYDQYGPPSFPPNTATAEEKNQSRQRAARDLTPQAHAARIWQAVESPRQLQEVMTEFWFNHFNIYEPKDDVRYWTADFERSAIRPNALGNFRTLLGAVAHHPAMLYYLDNWLSSGVNTPEAKGRFRGLNENYGRELLELHTLGVDGGYTQADVITMARVLSGWTIDDKSMRAGGPPFVFNPRRHDAAPKIFMGRMMTVSAGDNGEQEGERALDLLATHPATAKFICTQLAQYFVSDTPDPALVQRLSQRFMASQGDIKAVLKTLFDSPQFWARKNYQTQFKTPYQYVVSSLRVSGTPVRNVRPVDDTLTQLGMPLYGWLTPEGYKYAQSVWLNPDAILRRINFASTLANGKSPIARDAAAAPPAALVAASMPAAMQPGAQPGMQPAIQNGMTPAAVAQPVMAPPDPGQIMAMLAPLFTAEARARIDSAPPNSRTSLILGAPAFMKR